MINKVHLLILNFLFFVFFGCNSNIPTETNVITDEPLPQLLIQYGQGEKTLFTIEYEHDKNGLLVKEIQTDSSQNPVMVREKIYTYNDTLVNTIEVLANGQLEYVTEHTYDSGNRLVRQESKDTEVISYIAYEYDDRGNAIKQESYNLGAGTSKMEFKYNDNDNLIEGINYDQQNNILKWNKNNYVDDTLRDIFFLSPQGDTTHHIVYEYENGLLKNEKELAKDGNTYILKTYTYDDDGNLVAHNASRYQKYRVVYLRDEEGRLEQEKYYDQYDQLIRVVHFK